MALRGMRGTVAVSDDERQGMAVDAAGGELGTDRLPQRKARRILDVAGVDEHRLKKANERPARAELDRRESSSLICA